MKCKVTNELAAWRRGLAVAYRKRHPEWSSRRIAVELGVTGERVRQYLEAAGLPTRAVRPSRPCLQCNARVPRGRRSYCSDACRYWATHMTVKCDWCGQPITRQSSQVKPYPHLPKHQHKHHFCDRRCLGSWAGHNYGFAAHPEHISLGCRRTLEGRAARKDRLLEII